ncbi:cell division topological specificity factor MinE [Helicobacter pylori]|uniref:cell division topological specificity factor MinE n=1 Tax=Helicobacter pylori TaxID=210 RepID=UPI00165A5E17|nr:cell division topological specificity factor MinE [Helicobacter pylori]MBH0228551.1 cell division topological specificity factor MinE [Helicobacter pylori]
MNFFDFFKNKGSAATATDRLKLILAKERTLNLPYMEEMRKEIIAVIQKYTKSSDIHFKTDSNQSVETIEVEIILPK